MAQIGQYQLGSFASPINGGALDANVVRGNDNSIVGVHDNHDNDPTIHVQSFPFASLPSASTLGRFLIANDTYRAYFDTGSVLQEIAYLSKAGGTLTGAITVPGVNRVTGSGAAAGTVAAWRLGDTNSGSSRDWIVSNGYGVGAAAIGALVFAHSAAANGDPILNTATEVLRLNSAGVVVTGTLTTAGLLLPSATATYDIGTTSNRWNSLYLAAGIVAGGSASFGGDGAFSQSAANSQLSVSSVGGSGRAYGMIARTDGSYAIRDISAGADRLVIAAGGATTIGSTLTVSGGVTGNASTATALQTARTINGTSFDGTANVTVPAAAGTLTGTALNATVTASSLTSVGTLTSLTTSGTATVARIKGTGSPSTLNPNANVASVGISGSDTAGSITFTTTGTVGANTRICTVAYSATFGTTAYVTVMPNASFGSGAQLYILAQSATGFDLYTTVAISSGLGCAVNYHAIG